MDLATVTSILFSQIISLSLCVFDFLIQVRQFDYVAARNRLSGNIRFALPMGFQVPVGCDSMPPLKVFTLGTIHGAIIAFPNKPMRVNLARPGFACCRLATANFDPAM